MDHPCGSCTIDGCNNGHGFDQNCPIYITHEKLTLQKNIENTRREFAQMEKTSSFPVVNARVKVGKYEVTE